VKNADISVAVARLSTLASAMLPPSLPSFPLLPSPSSDPIVSFPTVSVTSENLLFDFDPPLLLLVALLQVLFLYVCSPLLLSLLVIPLLGTEISPIFGHEDSSKKTGRSEVLIGGLISLPEGFESSASFPSFPPIAPRASGDFLPRGRSDFFVVDLLVPPPTCFFLLPRHRRSRFPLPSG
jgi:hypothetical protein